MGDMMSSIIHFSSTRAHRCGGRSSVALLMCSSVFICCISGFLSKDVPPKLPENRIDPAWLSRCVSLPAGHALRYREKSFALISG